MNATSTSTAITEMPKCQACGLTLEIRTNGTVIDDWCGLWYDHPQTAQFDLIGHTKSLLIQSPELNRQLMEMGGKS